MRNNYILPVKKIAANLCGRETITAVVTENVMAACHTATPGITTNDNNITINDAEHNAASFAFLPYTFTTTTTFL